MALSSGEGRIRMSRLIRVAVCALAVGAVFAAPTSAPAAVEQSLLHGEAFGSDLAASFEFFDVSCNPLQVSHVSFHAQGEASGPYPGPFDEVGSFTIGPLTQDSPSSPGRLIGPLLSFNARFTVLSGDTVIEGVKRLERPPFPTTGVIRWELQHAGPSNMRHSRTRAMRPVRTYELSPI
jgi:hypothetical protein